MKRAGAVKFPNSVQLFKFCQKILTKQKSGKLHDQRVGELLDFNPSDCSHWKRGEKNIKSILALRTIAEKLDVDVDVIHDLASGETQVEEAYLEYSEARSYQKILAQVKQADPNLVATIQTNIGDFVADIHKKCGFQAPPLYLPEIFKNFPYIQLQTIGMMDRLSRILKRRPDGYTIQFKKGDLNAQTRLSIVKDLARIIFESEQAQYPKLSTGKLIEFEKLLFVANLLLPKDTLIKESKKVDNRQDLSAVLSNLFWVPRVLISFQMQHLILNKYGKAEEVLLQTKESSAQEPFV